MNMFIIMHIYFFYKPANKCKHESLSTFLVKKSLDASKESNVKGISARQRLKSKFIITSEK